MNAAERAARLRLVEQQEDEIVRQEHAAAAARKHGNWRWRPVGAELQFRNRALPTLRIDVLRPEAADLLRAVAKALNEKPPPVPRMTKRERAAAERARKAWNKTNAAEVRAMAERFKETGGW